MAADATPLPPTALAVLGILSFERELSGYDVKKWADSSIRFFWWSPATSQIYSELRRLEERGYATSRDAPDGDGRGKRLYKITAAGRRALKSWLRDAPVDPPVLKHGMALRVWLGHLADPATLQAAVEAHRDWCTEMIEELERSHKIAEQHDDWRYPALVTDWGRRYYEAERDLATEMLAELRDGATR
jgi:DNA-binding PadR family transcriptional regulator